MSHRVDTWLPRAFRKNRIALIFRVMRSMRFTCAWRWMYQPGHYPSNVMYKLRQIRPPWAPLRERASVQTLKFLLGSLRLDSVLLTEDGVCCGSVLWDLAITVLYGGGGDYQVAGGPSIGFLRPCMHKVLIAFCGAATLFGLLHPEDRGSTILQDFCNCLPVYAVSTSQKAWIFSSTAVIASNLALPLSIRKVSHTNWWLDKLSSALMPKQLCCKGQTSYEASNFSCQVHRPPSLQIFGGETWGKETTWNTQA